MMKLFLNRTDQKINLLNASRRCIFNSGRGTVVTGRVEQGIIKVGEEIEIVGIRDTKKSVCTGVEMFRNF